MVIPPLATKPRTVRISFGNSLMPLFALLLFFSGSASAQVDMEALHIASGRGKMMHVTSDLDSSSNPKMTSELKMLMFGAVRIYQIGISKHSSGACSFVPSCSAYAVEALQKKPAPTALLAIADRLTRCHGRPDMAEFYPFDPKTGRYIDPVEHAEEPH